MNRTGNLWPQVTSFEALHQAAFRTLCGKRDRPEAGLFFRDLEANLLRLQRELVAGAYAPGPYRTFWIRDPKPRLISAAPFRDRVVHHALVAALEPVFERRFIFDSYACRTGKGQHRALARFVQWARTSRYVLKLDVAKFFPSIDHEILKARLRRVLKDRAVLGLCDVVIDGSNPQEPVAQWFPGDDLLTPLERRKGLPIGNLTSQFFGNVFLDPLDHVLKERWKVARYVRYVDDLCVCHADKGYLTDLRASIREWFLVERLRLNEGKSRVRQVKEGIEYLGFVLLPDRLRLNARGVARQRRRARVLAHGLQHGGLSLDDVGASWQAWMAHAAHGTTRELQRHALAGLSKHAPPPLSGLGSWFDDPEKVIRHVGAGLVPAP